TALISGSLGSANIRLSNLDFGRARAGALKPFGIIPWTRRRTSPFAGLTLRASRQLEKEQTLHWGPPLETKSAGAAENVSEKTKVSGLANLVIPNSYEPVNWVFNILKFFLSDCKHYFVVLLWGILKERIMTRCVSSLSKQAFIPDGTAAGAAENVSEKTKVSGLANLVIPNSYEVESLVTTICDTTSIAEFQLKLGGFQLRVVRDLTEKNKPPLPPRPTPVSAIAAAEAPANGSASASSLAIYKPLLFSGGIQAFIEKAADEGLVIIPSPVVGFFTRCRTIKGKRASPSCKEKQMVKEGQVICYIQQLAGELPVKSDVSGEVIKILREDGDPVGYDDPLIAILPSFPGIKKLQ
ncbi:Biotin carboxyl carrier protein of acetyl-CoA carboxylase, partial [Morella rubra]